MWLLAVKHRITAINDKFSILQLNLLDEGNGCIFTYWFFQTWKMYFCVCVSPNWYQANSYGSISYSKIEFKIVTKLIITNDWIIYVLETFISGAYCIHKKHPQTAPLTVHRTLFHHLHNHGTFAFICEFQCLNGHYKNEVNEKSVYIKFKFTHHAKFTLVKSVEVKFACRKCIGNTDRIDIWIESEMWTE